MDARHRDAWTWHLYRTSSSRTMNAVQYTLCYEAWVDMNPNAVLHWYNNADCDYFMARYMPRDVCAAYSTLKPGAFKADLFRLCVLHQWGGVYVDDKAVPLMSLDDIAARAGLTNESLRQGHPYFVSVRDGDYFQHGVHNGFIMASAGHPFLLAAIRRIVRNVEGRKYLSSPFDVTGPGCLKHAVNACMGRDVDHAIHAGHNYGMVEGVPYSFYLLQFELGPHQYIFDGHDPVMYKKYSALVFGWKFLTSERYEHMWLTKNIYHGGGTRST